MPLQLPPLAGLRLFEAAARHQSFKEAAAELNVTPSAVSHGVAALEAWLGVDLFERAARRAVRLTAAGRAYLPYVAEALSMIAIGTERVPGRRSDRRVSISVAPTFAGRWLMPRLHRFRALHPAVHLTLDTSLRQILFPLDGMDLAIRLGAGGWPGVESRPLLQERFVPVGSPGYLEGLGAPEALDWSRARLIHVVSIGQDWSFYLERAGLAVEPREALRLDTVQLAFDAAAEGLGLALGRRPLVDRDLASGRLATAPSPVVAAENRYWLVGATGEETRTEVRAFSRWILAEAELSAA